MWGKLCIKSGNQGVIKLECDKKITVLEKYLVGFVILFCCVTGWTRCSEK